MIRTTLRTAWPGGGHFSHLHSATWEYMALGMCYFHMLPCTSVPGVILRVLQSQMPELNPSDHDVDASSEGHSGHGPGEAVSEMRHLGEWMALQQAAQTAGAWSPASRSGAWFVGETWRPCQCAAVGSWEPDHQEIERLEKPSGC